MPAPLFATPAVIFSNVEAQAKPDSALDFAGALRVTADNLDSVGVDLVRVVELEVDILDNEGPNVVTEAVGIEVALQTKRISTSTLTAGACQTHLERQTGLDLVCEPICDCFVEVYEDLHGELGLDSALGDQVVERVREGTAQTVLCQPVHSTTVPRRRIKYLLRR
jgi:hypothetical protein